MAELELSAGAFGAAGHGIRLGVVWLFTVRHCMVAHNGGCGLRLHGWDGFILDNWFSGNRGAGFTIRDNPGCLFAGEPD